MAIKFTFKGFKEFQEGLNDIQRKQLPFATALALTNTAVSSAKAAKAEMNKTFDIKKKTFMKQFNPFPGRGMVIRAKKGPLDLQEAFVGLPTKTKSGEDLPNMGHHVEGGIRRPKGKKLSVPGKGLKMGARGVPKSRRPRALLDKKNHRIIQSRKGRDFIIKTNKGAFPKTKPKYLLIDKARIKPTLDFFSAVSRAAANAFPRKFIQAMERAMKTARR